MFLDKLKKADQDYRALFEHSTDGIIISNNLGHAIYLSPSIYRLLGYTVEETTALDVCSLVYLSDTEGIRKTLDNCVDHPGIPSEVNTIRIKHNSGHWIWVEATITNMLDNLIVNGIYFNLRDISERKLAEKKLVKANRLYDFLSQVNKAIIHSEDEQTIFKDVCRIAIETGKFKAAWIAMINVVDNKIDIVEESGLLADDIFRIQNNHQDKNCPQFEILQTRQYYVCNNIETNADLIHWKQICLARSSGSLIIMPLTKSGNIIGSINLYATEINFFNKEEINLGKELSAGISFALDAFETNKKRIEVERSLQHNELRFNRAQAITHLGSWEFNYSTGILTLSEEALRIHGLLPGERQQSYESWILCIHPDDLVHATWVIKKAASSLSDYSLSHRIIRKDGTLRHVFTQAYFEINNEGKPVGLYGITHDITQIKEAEEKLHKSESNLQAIFENTADGFILADSNGEVRAFNNKSKDIIQLNIGKEIKVGESIYDFIHESRKAIYENTISKVLAGEVLRYDHSYGRKNGEIKWYSYTINPVYTNGRIKGLSISSVDITDRKITEELLLNSQSNLKAIIEHTDASIYSLDRDFRYITFNKLLQNAMKEIYGLDVKPGEKVFDFLKKLNPKEAREWQDAYSKALNGETIKFEKEFSVKDFYSYVSFSIYPIWDNKIVIGLSCFALDITRQKQAEQTQRQIESRYRQIVETAQEGIWLMDENNRTTFVNKKMCEILEYSEDEIIGKENLYFMDEVGKLKALELLERRKKGIKENFEMRFITKNGKHIWTTISANPIFDDHAIYKGALGMVSDITEKKNLETLLDKTNDLARIGSWEIDMLNDTLFWSSITKQIHGVAADYKPEIEETLGFYKAGFSRLSISQAISEAMQECTAFDLEIQLITPANTERWVRVVGETEILNAKCVRVYGSFQDIDERKTAELDGLKAYEEKVNILESIGDAFFAVDKKWIVTYWNKEAEKILCKLKHEIVGKNLWKVFSDSMGSESFRKYNQAIETNKVVVFEDHYEPLSKWFEISAYPTDNGLSVYFKDISERKISDIEFKKLNLVLQDHAKELAISNKELEQFAYVASHDLQEPLRMVTSFLTVIEKKYGNIIGAKGKQYIHYAVDGASRMRQIILDLLEFSRAGKAEDKLEEVDLNELMKELIPLFQKQIQETKADIKIGILPILKTFHSPVRQLFQNLISNSLKYSKKNVAPEIIISSKDVITHWQFNVTDNGIGIDSQYFDKIFIIFQRLHNKDEYHGTGMGLAICRKIVDNLGGKIWVESETGKGSSFCFTLPKQF